MMADAIADYRRGPARSGKIFNVARSDKGNSDQRLPLKRVLVGTSTMNNVMMPKIAGLVEEMTGLRFRNKRASAFGSHGWSGGAVDRLSTRLQDAGFEMSLSLKANGARTSTLELCEHGREIARQWALALPAAPQRTEQGRNRKLHACAASGSRSRPVDAVQRLPVGLRSGDRRAERDVQPGTPWSESRISLCRNALSVKRYYLMSWQRRRWSDGIVIIGSRLCGPSTGEKYS